MVDDVTTWRSSALSRRPRPRLVAPCAGCGKPLGTNYGVCARCFHAVEDLWLADWQALLGREQVQPGSPDENLLAQVVIDESDRHPFTVLDIGLTLQRCHKCGN